MKNMQDVCKVSYDVHLISFEARFAKHLRIRTYLRQKEPRQHLCPCIKELHHIHFQTFVVSAPNVYKKRRQVVSQESRTETKEGVAGNHAHTSEDDHQPEVVRFIVI